MFKSWRLIFFSLFGLVIFLPSLVGATNCDDPSASWNQDYFNTGQGLSPLFACDCGTGNSERGLPTWANNGAGCSGACGTCAAGESCRCLRPSDCDAIGGVCFNPAKNEVKADAKYDDGDDEISKPELKDYTEPIANRCPGGKDSVCYIKKPNTPAKPLLQPSTPSQPSVQTVSLSGCCSEIVPDKGAKDNGDYGLNAFIQVIVNIYKCILCLVAALVLLMFVLGAFTFMTSAGNEARVKVGKQILTGAVVGAIIVFGSVLIVNFTIRALGADQSYQVQSVTP